MKSTVGFLLIIILVSISDLSAETTIPGGNVTGNWYKANSPYNVTGNITVPAGSTLTIEPGVQVIFSGIYSFNVNGYLYAIGTALDSISFTAGINWNGIYFGDAPDSSKLVFCRISKSSLAGIICYNSNPVITHSTISNNGGAIYGGIYLSSSNPAISFCEIKNNVNSSFGGGIRMTTSSPQISHCIISGNKSTSNGGGIWCAGMGTPHISNCDIVGNQAGAGGGIYISESNMFLGNCTISDNNSGLGGGITFTSGGQVTITDCIITADTTVKGFGGGIYVSSPGGSLTINSSIISNCKAPSGGGIYISQAAYVSIIGSTFESNYVSDGGGAMYINQAGTVSILSTTLDDNYCGSFPGGVIYSVNCSNLVIDHCDVVNNRAAAAEGGIQINGNTSINVKNSIFRNQDGPHIWFENYTSASVTYTDFYESYSIPFYGGPPGLGVLTTVNANGDSCDVYSNILLDPLFVDFANGDYHLTGNSPCIDAGDPLVTDPDRTISDIGAIFYSQPPDADFESDITQGEVPLTVHFLDKSIGELTNWSWDFGDGNTSTEQNPANIFNTPGVYSVTLNITGIKGTDSETKTGYITVSNITNIEASKIESELIIKPNPAASACIITFSLKESNNVKMVIFNSHGQIVRVLYNENLPADNYSFEMDISDLPDGLYFVSLRTNTSSTIEKLIVIK